MVKVYLLNFAMCIYEGTSIYDAMDEAEAAGFEANVTVEGSNDMFFSPISGWRILQKNSI
jgi:hypothetical protein